MGEDARHLEALRRRFQRGERLKYLFFWGHTPARQGELGRECLSQWYPAPFERDGERFATAEHYMMWRKARLFGDAQSARRVLASRSPAEAKRIGRGVERFDDVMWIRERFAIVVEGSRAKFSQSPSLRAFLLGTGKRVLVEASPVDRVWGIGLEQSHDHAETPTEWRGLNLLGFALMEARATLDAP